MWLIIVALLSALVGLGASQDASPSPAPYQAACYVDCFSTFLGNMTNTCGTTCTCAGTRLVNDFECCMASCPASEQASISPSAKNMCADGKSLNFDFSCKPYVEKKPSSTGDVVAAAETDAAASNGAAGGGGGAGGAGGGIGSNGGAGNSSTIKLSLGSRVGVNVAVVLVGIALI
ncbi:hypothetical protein CSOJ01_09456 [Colletotrichum sojae]|uniref:Extracellular membrane protein CFEM domain-containing protein n=1 Tax=Colletotrichum sojae TaxID=2175907 RepID=A0A8H6J2Z6_9PEZI|nr:hypothetical protein CSOJ01_09456 [Colletotrichum sojae]